MKCLQRHLRRPCSRACFQWVKEGDGAPGECNSGVHAHSNAKPDPVCLPNLEQRQQAEWRQMALMHQEEISEIDARSSS